MTFLLIQIPCFNEEKTLPFVFEDMPKEIPGIHRIEFQIIDDGSTDRTVEVARSLGIHHILQHLGNKGLGKSFQKGIDHAVQLGADVLVNTDGDNQYPSSLIPDLIQPILKKEADIVIGDRRTSHVKHFSLFKKFFQWLGTLMTRILSGDRSITDAVSGFRAYSNSALKELNITTDFSYVLDSSIQASNKKLKMVSLPITTNPPTRPSRLFSSMWQHIRKSTVDLLRTFAFYKPLRVFFGFGFILFILGSIPIIRFLYAYFFVDAGVGKIQSLIIGSILLSVSFNCFALGVIGDLLSRNRKLVERMLKKMKEIEG